MTLRATSDIPAPGGLDGRLIATMRLAISSSVLFSIGPSEIELAIDAFQVPSVLYALYSALLYAVAHRPFRPSISKILNSADVGWVVLLILCSDNVSLAFLFLFSTTIAAFQWGFRAALRLTLFAASFSALAGLAKALWGADLAHHEIVLPPLYLVVFGYLLACWGAREIAARRRLVLLKEISRLSNPRFGVDRIVGSTMERLRDFYDADTCLMVAAEQSDDTFVLRRASAGALERACQAEVIPADTAQLLLSLPGEYGVIFSSGAQLFERWRVLPVRQYVFDIARGRRVSDAPPVAEALSATIDADSFVSVPLRHGESAVGRLYLTRT
ncbi:MAG TPA: hypothetical protein VFX76_05280, partial [Roseiflexaceae bacterium]|nr:hypothetical protein [Roseiflexaceae bacterium]